MSTYSSARRHEDGLIIAIDGPAGSGKSSTAQAVAEALNYRHLNSGAFYRALTFAVLARDIPQVAWNRLTVEDLESFGVEAQPVEAGYRFTHAGEDITAFLWDRRISQAVPHLATSVAVRTWVQRHLREAGQRGGLVSDGRDIGTIIYPDAELKVFLTCAPEERARRRLRHMGVEASREQVTHEMQLLKRRDELDAGRTTAPLLQADDAVVIDTTGLTFDQQVDRIVALARERGGVDPSEEIP
jgi:cytidylate kinase